MPHCEIEDIKKYVRATNYLSAAQIYLQDNFIGEEKLKPEKVNKPEKDITAKDIFATMHYVLLSNMKYKASSIPQVFAFGNAIWLAHCKYDSDILGGLSTRSEMALCRGEKWPKLLRPQLRGEIWLRRFDNTLCGPDEFYDQVIQPLGIDFFFGTLLPEMKLFMKDKKITNSFLVKLFQYNWNKCPKMRRIRRKEKRKKDRIKAQVDKVNTLEKLRSAIKAGVIE